MTCKKKGCTRETPCLQCQCAMEEAENGRETEESEEAKTRKIDERDEKKDRAFN